VSYAPVDVDKTPHLTQLSQQNLGLSLKTYLKGIISPFAPAGWGQELKRESAEHSAVMPLAEVSLDHQSHCSGWIVPRDAGFEETWSAQGSHGRRAAKERGRQQSQEQRSPSAGGKKGCWLLLSLSKA